MRGKDIKGKEDERKGENSRCCFSIEEESWSCFGIEEDYWSCLELEGVDSHLDTLQLVGLGLGGLGILWRFPGLGNQS